MERTCTKGRWESTKSAKVYIMDALAASVRADVTDKMRALLYEAAKTGLARTAELRRRFKNQERGV